MPKISTKSDYKIIFYHAKNNISRDKIKIQTRKNALYIQVYFSWVHNELCKFTEKANNSGLERWLLIIHRTTPVPLTQTPCAGLCSHVSDG